MGRSLLKWLASIGTGAATAVLAYVTEHAGNGPEGVDPLVTFVAVSLLTKLVGWLTSKMPATSQTSTGSGPY